MQERIFLFSLPLQVATVALAVKNPPANAGVMRHEFDPRVGEYPLEEGWQSSPVFLLTESRGQRSLEDYSP